MPKEQEVLRFEDREVVITNPGKVFFEAIGATKLDLVRFYLAVERIVLNEPSQGTDHALFSHGEELSHDRLRRFPFPYEDHLDEIVKLLKANPDIKRLSVEGHTDDRGALEMNNKLSQDRADSVKNYLVSHGIDAGRLESHGFGPSKPIDTNETEEGRAKNRRVDFTIMEEQKK